MLVNSATTAQQLLLQGRVTEAEQEFRRVLAQSPDNVEALNAIALAALRSGDGRQALELLDRAALIEPDNPMTQHHLGRAHELLGDAAAAALAYRSAIALRPDFYVARLQLANLFGQLGESEPALLHSARAIADAQRQGRWVDPASTPAALRPAVEQAVKRLRSGRRAWLAGVLEPLRAEFGASELRRVDRCLRMYLGEETISYPDPRQRPSFLYFPDLPATPYLDRARMPWIAEFESCSAAIHAELLALLPATRGRERVFTTEELERENLRGMDRGPASWTGYYLYRYGLRREDNCRACPATALAIGRAPLARIREHAPEVLFSVFTPGTHLLPHRGVTNTRVVAHLPLIIPADCALRVGGELHQWEAGKVVVFDDTYEHEAWNRSDTTRVVLIFDVWNPWLTDAEQSAVSRLIEALGDFRVALQGV
jgi:aspartate beta-hydroxylase